MKKCPNCNFENQDNSQFCQKCGAPLSMSVPQSQSQQSKNSSGGMCTASMVLGIVGLVLTFVVIGIVPAIIGLVLGIIALIGNKPKRSQAIAGVVLSGISIILFALLMIVSSIPENHEDNDIIKNEQEESKSNDELSQSEGMEQREEENEISSDDNSNEKVDNQNQGVTGIEVQKENQYGTIDEFDYTISGTEIILEDFKAKNKILEVNPTYTVDGKEYSTNLSDFNLGSSSVTTLIINEGITEVNTSIFNSSNVERIFFPKSMINVYDYTLAYLHPNDGEKIEIYYAGTQDEWSKIFTEYKRMDSSEAEWGEEKGKAWADALNEMLGVEYDSSLFEYFFSASPNDLKK